MSLSGFLGGEPSGGGDEEGGMIGFAPGCPFDGEHNDKPMMKRTVLVYL